MNSSKNYFATDRTFMTMVVLALLCGIVFFVTSSLDFLVTAIKYNNFTVSNAAYFFAKTTATIGLPLVFIIPSIKRTGRIKPVKFLFALLGILHLISLSWVIKFIAENGFANIFSDSIMTSFQATHKTINDLPVISNIAFWDTYSWIGCLFTIIFSLLCFWAAICFDDKKSIVCTTMTVITIFRIFAPLVLDLILGKGFWSGLWLTTNYVDVVCWVLLTLATFTAAKYDETWISLIWDQEIPQNEDEQ